MILSCIIMMGGFPSLHSPIINIILHTYIITYILRVPNLFCYVFSLHTHTYIHLLTGKQFKGTPLLSSVGAVRGTHSAPLLKLITLAPYDPFSTSTLAIYVPLIPSTYRVILQYNKVCSLAMKVIAEYLNEILSTYNSTIRNFAILQKEDHINIGSKTFKGQYLRYVRLHTFTKQLL